MLCIYIAALDRPLIWYEGLDGSSDQYFFFHRGLCRELWVGSIFTCPPWLWSIDQQAHRRPESHQYSLQTSVNGLHVYMQKLSHSTVSLAWPWTLGVIQVFESIQAEEGHLKLRQNNSVQHKSCRPGVSIVVSPHFPTFPWVYNRFILLIFPTPLFPIAPWQSMGNL